MPENNNGENRITVKKAAYVTLGCIGAALGAVGAVLPVLPTVPFFMLAAFCFLKSSARLHAWFTGTGLYQKNLRSFMGGKGMTGKTKLRVIAAITLVMGFGFLMMGRVPAARIALAAVWALHILYFCFGVKTIPAETAGGNAERVDTP